MKQSITELPFDERFGERNLLLYAALARYALWRYNFYMLDAALQTSATLKCRFWNTQKEQVGRTCFAL